MSCLRCVLICAAALCAAAIVPAASHSCVAAERSTDSDPQSLSAVIDRHVEARLQSANIAKSPAADDEEFVRRVYLDLHGVVPRVEQTTSFLADEDVDKRAQLVDRLLADPHFAAHLADLWDDYLMPAADDLRSQKQQLKAWLAAAFQEQSWDQIATALVTAEGQRDKDPQVSYLLKGRETLTPAETTDLVSQYFLGVRLNCAQCHDHPFADWKQSEYWGMAAFFTQFQYTDRRQQKSGVIRDNPNIDLAKLAETDRLRTLKFPKGDEWSTDGTPHRQAFARWLTAPDNPYFARAAVNRIWAQLFGRGLVEPVDDLHDGNPASHPELLDELSEAFVAAKFDLRAIYRAVCNSAAYQRTSRPVDGNEQDTLLLSRMRMKLLTPEQLFDSLAVVLPPTAASKRYQQANDPREEFVGFFRTEGDWDPTTYTRGIPQTLRMMNSSHWGSPRLADAVQEIVGDDASNSTDVERLYLHVLARRPTAEERTIVDRYFEDHAADRDEALTELFWSLVNGGEFSLNH